MEVSEFQVSTSLMLAIPHFKENRQNLNILCSFNRRFWLQCKTEMGQTRPVWNQGHPSTPSLQLSSLGVSVKLSGRI